MSNTYGQFFEKAQIKRGLKAPSKPMIPIKRRSKTRTESRMEARKSPSKGWLVFLLFGFFVTSIGAFLSDDIEKFLSKLEVSFLSSAFAEDTPPASKANERDSKITSDSIQKSKDTEKTVEAASTDSIEMDHLAHLRDRKKELDEREAGLNKVEAELAVQREELDKKLSQLEETRKKISSLLEERVQSDDLKIDNLVQFYSSMKPVEAAKIVDSIDEDLAVKVLSKMKKKTAADLMNFLKPEKSKIISEKYVGYRK